MARSQKLLGLRGGFYTDADALYLGGGVLMPMSRALDFNPNLEYVLIDGGSYMDINFDVNFNILECVNFYK